jgi:hypothetical protein
MLSNKFYVMNANKIPQMSNFYLSTFVFCLISSA